MKVKELCFKHKLIGQREKGLNGDILEAVPVNVRSREAAVVREAVLCSTLF